MPSLSAYCEALAVAGSGLGGWFRFVSTAASSGPDAARTVICADLADDDDGGTLYQQGYLYATDGNVAGEQRRVSVFDGTSGGVASFITTAPFRAVPSVGITWEYSATLPRKQHGQVPGLRDIVNQTLRKLWVPSRYTFDGNGSYAYAVPHWVTSQAQIGDLYDTGSALGRNPYRTSRPVLRSDDQTPMLEVGTLYSAAQRFDVLLYRPATSYLKLGGTWQETLDPMAGLIDDEDEALAPLDDVVTVGLAYAYSALAYPHPGVKLDYWVARADAQKLLAGAVKALSLPEDISGGRLMTSGGGRRGSEYWP